MAGGTNLVHEHLFGVERNGRLAVLYSSKDYSSEWSFHPENKRFLSVDNTRFGVNRGGVCPHALTSPCRSPRPRMCRCVSSGRCSTGWRSSASPSHSGGW